MISLICARTNVWASNRNAGDFRGHRAHYGVIEMTQHEKCAQFWISICHNPTSIMNAFFVLFYPNSWVTSHTNLDGIALVQKIISHQHHLNCGSTNICKNKLSVLIFMQANSASIIKAGLVFCLLLRVSSDYAQPITCQVTEVTCPVIARAQPELTPSRRQKRACHDRISVFYVVL